MAQATSPYPYFTVDEYFAFEETADTRHEYLDGQLYALAGASARHNRIVKNLIRHIDDPAEAQGCELSFSEMKLQVTDRLYYYPDLMVSCDSEDDHPLFRRNPCLVVEILSPSTEAHDRREKLFAYRQIESLQAYVMVWQDKMRVQRHYRTASGEWANAEVSGTGLVPVPCPDLTLTLDDIYRGVDYSAE
jgi:Uma2 family endonuclease